MNEKFLNDFLASAIRSGDISLEFNDEIVDRILQQPGAEISDASRARFKSQLKVRIEDAAIATARESVQGQPIAPFGRFIETVREHARLNRSAVAERLKKTDDFVERLERGHINPLQLATREFADIVELFRLKLSALPAMMAASAATAGTKHNYRAIARSHGGVRHKQRGEDVERALEAFARTVQPKATGAPNTSDEIRSCLAKLEDELKRRGRADLIT